jgi:hypothetical protein
MEVRCPKCDRLIDSEDVNVGADTAFCRDCDEAFKLSELVHGEEAGAFELEDPPKGAWFGRTADGFIIGARTRSKAGCFLIPFAIIWSGGSLGGIYGTQIASGEFNILLCLFGIPFLLGSILLWSMALMTIWGITVVKVEGTLGRVFSGIGSLGRTKNFDWSGVSTVREEEYSSGNNGSRSKRIVLEGNRRIGLGSMLNDNRRYYMLKALKKMLAERESG